MQVQAEDYYNENPGAAANIIDGAIVYLFCIECNVRGAAASRSQKSSATWRLLCPEFAYPRFTACSAPIFTTCLPLFSSRVPTSLLAPDKVRIVAEGSHPLRYFVGESFLPELKHVMEGTAVDWGERWEASTWDVRARCEREGTCTRRAGLVARVVRALCSGAVGRFLFYKRRARGCPFLDASASGIIAACVCANAFAFLGPSPSSLGAGGTASTSSSVTCRSSSRTPTSGSAPPLTSRRPSASSAHCACSPSCSDLRSSKSVVPRVPRCSF